MDTGDAVYRLDIGSIPGRHPAEDAVTRSIAGIRAAAGSWQDIDVEAFKAYVAERRRTGKRPPVRM